MPMDGHGRVDPMALIVRAGYQCGTGFTSFTDPGESQQVLSMGRPAGHVVPPHYHVVQEGRTTPRTQETLIVRKGSMRIDFYDYGGVKVDERTVRAGDVVTLFGGGHGIEFLEESDVLEIKQGPYNGRYRDKISL